MARAELPDDRKELESALDVLGSPLHGAACAEPEPEVLVDRQLPEDPASLGDERDAAARDHLRGAAAKRAVPEPDVATRDSHEAHDRVERRRLPGPVRADQTQDLARRDLERDAADRCDRPVAHLEVGDDERWAHEGPS